MSLSTSPIARLLSLVKLDRAEIVAIYFYAILSGLIQLSLPVGVQAIIGFVLGGAISSSLILLISLVVAGVLAAGLMQISQMKLIEKIQQKIFVRYAFDISKRLPMLDIKKADGTYLPELVNRFFETSNLQKSLSKLLLDIPTASIQILSGLVLLSFYHPAFIFFGLLLMFLLFVILYLSGSRGLRTSMEESHYKYAVAAWMEEMARVIRSFKFSGGTHINMQKSNENITGYLKARNSHFRVLLVQFRVLVLFKVIITASMLFVGAILLVDQQLNIGQFIAAEIVIITVINSVEKLIGNLDSVYDALTSVDKLAKIMDKELEANGTYPMPVTGFGPSLEMQNVSFGFSVDDAILKDISFKIKPGEKVAITGKGGSGKSTLLRLFTGAYTDFKGGVLIDSIPVGNYDLDSLRMQTGVFLGQQDIFQGTLMENITMGNPAVKVDLIRSIAEKTGLQGFISSLKMGYDTVLDPTGNRLPRSVVQKILLTRALVNKPGLLLLEEPWESQEDEYRQQIQQLLLNGLPGVTMLIIASDEAFIKKCDRVIHLSKGEMDIQNN
jgi:ATP-binding cassette, subfamily B, bacterial